MSNASNDSLHVAVIGGGPAGSTAAALIAQRGYKVALFERERFPRFHIGESLIPETYWVLKRLGMLDKMKGSHFVRKHSVQFISENGRVSAPFFFGDRNPHESSSTWQVRRSEFDQMMLQNAEEHGVAVHQETRVRDIYFDGERATGLRVEGPDGVRDVQADVVVDASGQSSMIANRFGLRVVDPDLKKGAVWTYFQGAYRDVGRNEGATMVIQTKGKKGWFWYIPLHDDIISVGVVSDFETLFKGRGDHETIYNEELARCPAVQERVSKAKRVTGYYATKDYSYRSTKVAGDGWVLVGDAFGFLDPLYSSGVLLALKSGQLAADAVCEGLAAGDVSAARLGNWGPDFIRGMDRMRKLVCEYYDGFSFGKFIRRHPDLQGNITDLLSGDLFRESVDEVWEPLDAMKEVETPAPAQVS